MCTHIYICTHSKSYSSRTTCVVADVLGSKPMDRLCVVETEPVITARLLSRVTFTVVPDFLMARSLIISISRGS